MPDTPNPSLDPETQPHQALVYGRPGGDLAFAPLDEARLYASMRRGEGFPMTWGEFRSRFGEAAYEVAVQPLIDEAEYASLSEFMEDFDADDHDCSAEEAYKDLPVGYEGRPPTDDDEAMFMDSEGNIYDTPESITYWPAQLMLDWFPEGLARKYGRVRDSVHDGEFLELDSGQCDEIVAALEALGFTCVEDDRLMDLAAGY